MCAPGINNCIYPALDAVFAHPFPHSRAPLSPVRWQGKAHHLYLLAEEAWDLGGAVTCTKLQPRAGTGQASCAGPSRLCSSGRLPPRHALWVCPVRRPVRAKQPRAHREAGVPRSLRGAGLLGAWSCGCPARWPGGNEAGLDHRLPLGVKWKRGAICRPCCHHPCAERWGGGSRQRSMVPGKTASWCDADIGQVRALGLSRGWGPLMVTARGSGHGDGRAGTDG